MKFLKTHLFWFWSVVIAQTAMVIIGFYNLVTDGQRRLFMDAYDGMRNYFAYNEYITQGKSSNYFLFEKMNYPFGDYIFYTDNTPILAVLVKWFSENIYDVSDYSLQIFHWFFTFTLVLSSVFLYLICKRLVQTKWLIAIFSLAIPWITPQLFRLGNGHFSLALSCCILATMYAIIVLYQHYHSQKNIWLPILGIILSVVISAFLHVYFLLISGFFIGYFCLVWAIFQYKNRRSFWKLLGMAGGVPVACLAIFLGIVRSIDTYYPHRSDTAKGFHFDGWQLKLDGLFDSHYYLSVPFFEAKINLHYESVAYLGSFAWYALGSFLLIFILKKFSKSAIKRYFIQTETAQLISILFISGVCCLFIAFGAKAYWFNNSIIFDNYLNPLYWLEKFIPQISQFRCMGRFNWVFFLTFNITMLYVLDQYFQNNRKKWHGIALIILLPTLLAIDTLDTMKFTRNYGWAQHLNNSPQLPELEKLLEGIDTKKYQAILPLPYYNSSCEDYHYTIDPEDKWCTTTYQLSHITDLPLMASRMGRTPLNQTYAFFEMFTTYNVPDLIKNELAEKPILVIYSTNEAAWQIVPNLEPAKTALLNGKDFPEKMNMKEIGGLGEWKVFEFQPK